MPETLRYFIDGQEVTQADAIAAETAGTAHVAMGGSGVVPQHLRAPGETEAEWLSPWMELRSADPS